MNRDEIEDVIWEAIADSLEMDWNPRDGAKAVLAALDQAGLQIVVGEPVAYLFEHPEGHTNVAKPSYRPTYEGWLETPLFAGKVLP